VLDESFNPRPTVSDETENEELVLSVGDFFGAVQMFYVEVRKVDRHCACNSNKIPFSLGPASKVLF
jgi:hypothetical protein